MSPSSRELPQLLVRFRQKVLVPDSLAMPYAAFASSNLRMTASSGSICALRALSSPTRRAPQAGPRSPSLHPLLNPARSETFASKLKRVADRQDPRSRSSITF